MVLPRINEGNVARIHCLRRGGLKPPPYRRSLQEALVAEPPAQAGGFARRGRHGPKPPPRKRGGLRRGAGAPSRRPAAGEARRNPPPFRRGSPPHFLDIEPEPGFF